MKKLTIICLLFAGFSTFSYAQSFEEKEVELTVENGKLGGVIMFPDTKKKTPVVLIIQGSGPTDKDGNSGVIPGNNNSLKMLAQALAEKGIASLRFDKRGQGMSKSAGKAEKDLTFDDFVNDAQSWLNYLIKDKRFRKVGVAGHSQGSLIGILISQNPNVSAFASIAGPSLGIDETIMTQIKANPYNPPSVIEETQKIIDTLLEGKTVKEVPTYLNSLFRPDIQPFISSWMKYKPQKEIAKLNIPIAVLNGTTDIQVTIDDANGLKKANPKAKLFIIDGMNHVLKDAPADRQQNMATYGNPDLALNELFKTSIVSFFVNNLKSK